MKSQITLTFISLLLSVSSFATQESAIPATLFKQSAFASSKKDALMAARNSAMQACLDATSDPRSCEVVYESVQKDSVSETRLRSCGLFCMLGGGIMNDDATRTSTRKGFRAVVYVQSAR